MSSKWTAFIVWALVAGCAVFWVLRLGAQSPAMPYATLAVSDGAHRVSDLSRLLGSTPTAESAVASDPGLSARFQLAGVMAPRVRAGESSSTSTGGVALLVVDGKPPRPFRTGARIDGDLVLQAVGLRSASIGMANSPAALVLELPAPALASTGSLPDVPPGIERELPSAPPPVTETAQEEPEPMVPREPR